MRQLKYDIKKTKNRHSNQTDKQKYIFFIFNKTFITKGFDYWVK